MHKFLRAAGFTDMDEAGIYKLIYHDLKILALKIDFSD